MNTILRTVLLAVVSVLGLHAQTVHRIPFASQGNTIELTVANSSTVAATHVKVEATNIPPWLRFISTEYVFQGLNASDEAAVLFAFSVEKSAPVNQEHRLQFRISTSDGQSWSKEIPVVIAAPETFELFQNYPNPFNPTTVIRYQLPVDSRVSLRIYNLLGQEVALLVDGERRAGYHRETFSAKGGSASGRDARVLASGVYVYQLSLTDARGDRTLARKRMLLLR